MPLRDVVVSNPRILFVGINPSLRSEEVGHHFAGPGNPFWRLLHAARVVPEPLSHTDDRRLARFGIALTNLCPRATRSASELTDAEVEAGREALLRKIRRLRPAVVAFVGLTVYQRVFRRATSGGAGAKPERLDGSRVFVLPNPSGLNASFPGFEDKLVWYERLRDFAGALLQAGADTHLASMPERGGGSKRAASRSRGGGRRSAEDVSLGPVRPAERRSQRLRRRAQAIAEDAPARVPAGAARTSGMSADTPRRASGAGAPEDLSVSEERESRGRRR